MFRKHVKRFMNNVHLIAVAVVLATGTGPLAAAEPASRATATVVTGELGGIEQSAKYVLNSTVAAGEALYLVLEDAADAGEIVLRVPRATLGDAALALGQSVTLVADRVGWLVQSAGKAIAVVPHGASGALCCSHN